MSEFEQWWKDYNENVQQIRGIKPEVKVAFLAGMAAGAQKEREASAVLEDVLYDVICGELVNKHYKMIAKRALNIAAAIRERGEGNEMPTLEKDRPIK